MIDSNISLSEVIREKINLMRDSDRKRNSELVEDLSKEIRRKNELLKKLSDTFDIEVRKYHALIESRTEPVNVKELINPFIDTSEFKEPTIKISRDKALSKNSNNFDIQESSSNSNEPNEGEAHGSSNDVNRDEQINVTNQSKEVEDNSEEASKKNKNSRFIYDFKGKKLDYEGLLNAIKKVGKENDEVDSSSREAKLKEAFLNCKTLQEAIKGMQESIDQSHKSLNEYRYEYQNSLKELDRLEARLISTADNYAKASKEQLVTELSNIKVPSSDRFSSKRKHDTNDKKHNGEKYIIKYVPSSRRIKLNRRSSLPKSPAPAKSDNVQISNEKKAPEQLRAKRKHGELITSKLLTEYEDYNESISEDGEVESDLRVKPPKFPRNNMSRTAIIFPATAIMCFLYYLFANVP